MTDTSSALAQINVAKNALTRVKSLVDAIEVRDRATAIAAYARAKGADEAHSLALEIKLRAERKAGGFLREMPKQHGARPSDTGAQDEPPSTLKELGINRIESQRSDMEGQKEARSTRSSISGTIFTA